jgi:hypothetical protein
VGGAVADVAIAAVLAWAVRIIWLGNSHFESIFPFLLQLLRERGRSLPATHSLITRVIRLTVETNALTGKVPHTDTDNTLTREFLAGVAVIALILFWGVPVRPSLLIILQLGLT